MSALRWMCLSAALVAQDGATSVPAGAAAADHVCQREFEQQPRTAVEAGAAGAGGQLELRVSVFHFPLGTSKWSKVEHRMFSHITQNWRGRPLVCREVPVILIGEVATKRGLRIRPGLDENNYEPARKVPNEELEQL